MRQMIPAYEFRRRARVALGKVMSVLILVTLIAMLPGLISDMIALVTDSAVDTAVTEIYVNAYASVDPENPDVDAMTAQIVTGLTTFVQEKWPWVLLCGAVTFVFSPVLTVGFYYALLRSMRGQEITPSMVLARLPWFFKALGTNLLMLGKTFLWMLPGYAVMMAAAVLMAFVPVLGILVMLAGLVLMLVQVIRAMYSYRLSLYVLADDPEMGMLACIRRSCEVMKGRRMELFSLELSFLGWRLLLSFVQSMLLGFGTVVGMTLGMFVSMFLQMYIYMAEAAFYQEYAVGPVEAAAPAAENEELN